MNVKFLALGVWLCAALWAHGSLAASMMRASWYEMSGRMANGRRFDPSDTTIVAHRFLPLGTWLVITNPRTGKSIYAQVLDRGPFVRGRQLDVSKAAARKLGFLQQGVATLEVVILQ